MQFNHIEIEDPQQVERKAWLFYGGGIITGLVLCGITILLVI